MDIHAKTLVTVLSLDLLFLLLAVPLVLRKVPRNGIYGYRTPATLGSDEIWYPANASFGLGLIGASVCSALAAVCLFLFRPVAPENLTEAGVVIVVLPTLCAVLATQGHIRRLTRQ